MTHLVERQRWDDSLNESFGKVGVVIPVVVKYGVFGDVFPIYVLKVLVLGFRFGVCVCVWGGIV